MTLRELNVKWIKEMMEFDQLCFPTDFWEERDWRSLLGDCLLTISSPCAVNKSSSLTATPTVFEP